MSSVKIHIKDDIYTIVDCDIAEKIRLKKLYLRSNRRKYVAFRHKGKNISLHRFVIRAKPGQIVDHINRKTLDNRRCNLRIVTQSENILNTRTEIKCKSNYMRVQRSSLRWKVLMNINGKYTHSGSFKNIIVAALFADRTRIKYSSVTPRLNFPSRIKRCHLYRVLGRTKGRIFSVVFARRKDGHERHMVCRINVNKNIKGDGLLFEPEHVNLLPVYDVRKKDYRFIPLENVLCLTFRKKRYRVL